MKNKTDLLALTLVGPTRNNPVLDPLAVLQLDNQLYICTDTLIIFISILKDIKTMLCPI